MSPRPRTPGAVYSVVSVMLLAVLSAVAFSTRQPPPPTIAEFAPQALDQIEEAPEEQTSTDGPEHADCPPDFPGCVATTTLPTTTSTTLEEAEDRPTIDVARVRRCVGDPPRQIEDPQSPPCVPFWEGDNGGATSKGVTRDEIRIAFPGLQNGDESSETTLARAFVQFFNRRFEFYGRKLRLIPIPYERDERDAVEHRNAAVYVDEQAKAFAATAIAYEGAYNYQRELARRGIISLTRASVYSDELMSDNGPYMWGYPMSTLSTLTASTAQRPHSNSRPAAASLPRPSTRRPTTPSPSPSWTKASAAAASD